MRYKFNIQPENCKYIVDENKRKVICIIENTRNTFISFAAHNFVIDVDYMDWSAVSHRSLSKQLEMPNRFWGIATCDENDTWDEETGKLVAFSKAKDKLNKSFFKRANLYVFTIDKYLNDAVDMLNRLGTKLENSTEMRHKKIAEIVGEPEV